MKKKRLGIAIHCPNKAPGSLNELKEELMRAQLPFTEKPGEGSWKGYTVITVYKEDLSLKEMQEQVGEIQKRLAFAAINV